MQQFKRTLLRIFMMLFLVAGVSTFMVMNANAVFADELDASDDTKVEESAVAAEVAESALTTDETSDVAEDLTDASETDSDEVEDANKEVLLDAEVEVADDNGTVTEEAALETTTPVAEATETTAEEVVMAVKHLTVYAGVDYAAVYDFEYYQDTYSDIKDAYGDDEEGTLYHFIQCGMNEQRQGIATFDEISYRRAYVDLRLAFGNAYAKYYLHYMNCGQREGRDQIVNVKEVKNPVTEYAGVNYALVYNYNDYQTRYTDIKNAFGDDDVATLNHFITCGMNERRQGISTFDVQSYRRAYPDLRAAFGTNYPSYYLHYINCGYKEGRTKTTGITEMTGFVTEYKGVDYALVYDFNYYQKIYADIKKAYGDNDTATLAHFVGCGMNEQRQGISTFDEKSYRRAYVDLRLAFGTNYKQYYLHYINSGHDEKRAQTTNVKEILNPVTTFANYDLSSIYDYKYYTETYQDVNDSYGKAEDDIGAFEHFIKVGIVAQRQGKASYDIDEYNEDKEIFTGFANASTKVADLELSMVYDFYYYYEHNGDLRDAYGTDADAYVNHFALCGLGEGRKGKASYRTDVYNMFKDTFTRYAQGNSSFVAMDQLAQKYSSSTKYLITISYTDHIVSIYEHVISGVWTKTHWWRCSMGASATATPTGQFTTSDKCYYFDSGYSRCFYATRVNGSIMMHSVLYYQNPGPTQVMDGTLGANVSHGCIRMPLDGCKWVYDNIPAGTKCAIYYR